MLKYFFSHFKGNERNIYYCVINIIDTRLKSKNVLLHIMYIGFGTIILQ